MHYVFISSVPINIDQNGVFVLGLDKFIFLFIPYDENKSAKSRCISMQIGLGCELYGAWRWVLARQILYINNNNSEHKRVAAYLTNLDFQLQQVADISQAKRYVQQGHDYVVILYPPNNATWVQQLQQLAPMASLLCVSAEKSMHNMQQALDLGVDYYVDNVADNLITLVFAINKSLQQQQLAQQNQLLEVRLQELQQDQRAGHQVQFTMLPDIQEFDAYQCRHLLQPSLLLSGDFLDYFSLDKQQIGFYLADVSGHGVSSAFITVLLKNLTYRLRRNLRRKSSDDLLNPKATLKRIHQELLTVDLDKYLTLIYGIIDSKTHTMRYSVAGHSPNPIVYSQGKAQYLTGKGSPLGLFAEVEHENYQFDLAEDASLWLFSDGILELFAEQSEQILLDKLSSALAANPKLSCMGFAETLGIQPQTRLVDDVSMINICRNNV